MNAFLSFSAQQYQRLFDNLVLEHLNVLLQKTAQAYYEVYNKKISVFQDAIWHNRV